MIKRVVGAKRPLARRARRTRITSTPLHKTAGGQAAAQWLRERKLGTAKPWYVEIALDVVETPAAVTYFGDTDTRFHLNVYPEEWSVFFCHGSRSSWVRVTDEPFIHGRDDHDLLHEEPELPRIGYLLHTLEQRFRLRFRRDRALVRTNLVGGERAIRDWLLTI